MIAAAMQTTARPTITSPFLMSGPSPGPFLQVGPRVANGLDVAIYFYDAQEKNGADVNTCLWLGTAHSKEVVEVHTGTSWWLTSHHNKPVSVVAVAVCFQNPAPS